MKRNHSTKGTVDFIRYCANYGSVSVYTEHRYGICGFGYSAGKPDPQYTHGKP